MPKKETSLEILQSKLVCDDPLAVPMEQLVKMLVSRSGGKEHLPESHYQIDPRDGEITIFSVSRAQRPKSEVFAPDEQPIDDDDSSCPICAGNLNGVCHIQELSEGASFITENLYPVVHPHGLLKANAEEEINNQTIVRGGDAFGGHFIQWTNSIHDKDWHNMTLADLLLTMQQLVKIEEKLLHEALVMPKSAGSNGESRGYLSIFKNFGSKAGASLTHGHQQILFANVMCRSSYNNWRFYTRHLENFSDYMLRENPAELLVKDYGDVVLLVPYFMPRPYSMMIFVKHTDQSHLYHLPEQTLVNLTEAMQDAIIALRSELKADGKPEAYNYLIHTGPGCGLYVEFMPRADAYGGLEMQGTWVCQALPTRCAERLRARLTFC
jgi:galactose-1-phosphate uridylyltransferase